MPAFVSLQSDPEGSFHVGRVCHVLSHRCACVRRWEVGSCTSPVWLSLRLWQGRSQPSARLCAAHGCSGWRVRGSWWAFGILDSSWSWFGVCFSQSLLSERLDTHLHMASARAGDAHSPALCWEQSYADLGLSHAAEPLGGSSARAPGWGVRTCLGAAPRQCRRQRVFSFMGERP